MNTTHLGSMPFKDIQIAIEWSKKFELVTVPELPKLDDSQCMLKRASAALALSKGQMAFSNLVDKFDCSEIKIHCAGPVTVEMLEKGSFSRYFELLLEASSVLSTRFDKLWICLDEPSLNYSINVDRDQYSSYLNQFSNVQIGIHNCDSVRLENLFIEDINFLSVSYFQLTNPLDELFALMKDKTLMLGTLDTKDNYLSMLPSIDLSSAGNLYLTPSCGLGTLNPKLATAILSTLNHSL
jgi:methionine synthase II (cobalamin-independent)